MDRTKVSFAEAEGELPSILKWGQIDQRLRSSIWTPFYLFFDGHIDWEINRGGDNHYLKKPLSHILAREFVYRRHRFVHELEDYFDKDEFIHWWSDFFKNSNYVELFDFITFFVRDGDCPKDFARKIAIALDLPFSPYRLSVDALTIFPAIDEQQAKALEGDLEKAFKSPFAGSKSHIQSALSALGNGDYRASVRESIHAVESAVRDFTADPNAVLSRALKSLVSEQNVHKALADAFDKLYAYSSDESGIRHALVFGENEKVGLDEATFFLSACTAFVGFLGRKKLSTGSPA